MLSNGASGLTVVGQTTLSVNEVEYSCQQLHLNHGIPGKLPIFQGVNFRLLDQPLQVMVPEPNKYLVVSKLASPGMEGKVHATFVVWNGTDTSLVSA